jgi:hypothetical protein
LWDEKPFRWDKLTNPASGWLKTEMARDHVDMVFRIMVRTNSKIHEATMGMRQLIPKRTGCDPDLSKASQIQQTEILAALQKERPSDTQVHVRPIGR